MQLMKRQAGVSMLGVLIIVCLFAFFLTVALRLLPPWMEGRKIKTVIEQVAEDSNAAQSLRDVTRRIESSFTTNMVEGIKSDDVKVFREKNTIVIDASYEARTNLFSGVDAVIVFDDLRFTVD